MNETTEEEPVSSSTEGDKEPSPTTTSTTTTSRIPEGKFTLIKTVPATSGSLFMHACHTEFVWLASETYGKHFHRFAFRDACLETSLAEIPRIRSLFC